MVVAHAMQEDDVVVVNDEWGRIEEVNLTHVVMRMWDERRLTLPTTYFTERPFQNLTRHDARVISEVTLHLDFTAELNELRSEAQRLLEANPLWERDNKWQLQMVDATPQTVAVQLRAWAADSTRRLEPRLRNAGGPHHVRPGPTPAMAPTHPRRVPPVMPWSRDAQQAECGSSAGVTARG